VFVGLNFGLLEGQSMALPESCSIVEYRVCGYVFGVWCPNVTAFYWVVCLASEAIVFLACTQPIRALKYGIQDSLFVLFVRML